jgi:hypothetical protein
MTNPEDKDPTFEDRTFEEFIKELKELKETVSKKIKPKPKKIIL